MKAKARGWVLLLVLGCESSQRVETPAPGAAAWVAGEPISVDVVRQIAVKQGISAERALEFALNDAVFAAAARQAPGGERIRRHAERATGARLLLEALLQEAKRQGPPSDQAVGELTAARWWELDRPELRRTLHAVARIKGDADRAKARALIERVAAATNGITDAGQFANAARDAGKESAGLELRVELLDPVAADGRTVDPQKPPLPGTEPGRLVERYVDAVYALQQEGERSPIFETEFGFHVALLVEVLPERRLSLAERRQLLTPELLADRARSLESQLIDQLRRTTDVTVERAALELTKKVAVGP